MFIFVKFAAAGIAVAMLCSPCQATPVFATIVQPAAAGSNDDGPPVVRVQFLPPSPSPIPTPNFVPQPIAPPPLVVNPPPTPTPLPPNLPTNFPSRIGTPPPSVLSLPGEGVLASEGVLAPERSPKAKQHCGRASHRMGQGCRAPRARRR